MKTNQKGFSALEGILIVIIIGMIAGVGWFVLKSNKQTEDTQKNTVQTQNDVEKKEDKVQPNPGSTKQYLEFKELGVKLPLTDSLKGLYYTLGNNGKTAYLSLESLKNTGCKADGTPQFALTRHTDSDFQDNPTIDKEDAKKIGDYYFTGTGGQAACSDDESVQRSASQMRGDLSSLIPASLEPME